MYCPTTDTKEARLGEKAKEDDLDTSTGHESSLFDIPTKENHMANNGIHEIPTKDTEGPAQTATGEEENTRLSTVTLVVDSVSSKEA